MWNVTVVINSDGLLNFAICGRFSHAGLSDGPSGVLRGREEMSNDRSSTQNEWKREMKERMKWESSCGVRGWQGLIVRAGCCFANSSSTTFPCELLLGTAVTNSLNLHRKTISSHVAISSLNVGSSVKVSLTFIESFQFYPPLWINISTVSTNFLLCLFSTIILTFSLFNRNVIKSISTTCPPTIMAKISGNYTLLLVSLFLKTFIIRSARLFLCYELVRLGLTRFNIAPSSWPVTIQALFTTH